MPQAIAAFFVSLGASAAVAAGIAYVVMALITYAMSQNQASRAKRKARDQYNAGLEDRLVMAARTNGYRSRVYGRVRNVDGIVFDGTHGPHSKYYTLVIALAGHEVDAIETVYFNDQPVTLVADGQTLSDGRQGYWVTDAPYQVNPVISETKDVTVTGGAGVVVLDFDPVAGSVLVSPKVYAESGGVPPVDPSKYTVVGRTVTLTAVDYDAVYTVSYQYIADVRYARVWKYLGAPGQNIGTALLKSRFPDLISDTDRFEGMAALVVELEFSQDAFPTGVPQISAVMRGAKIRDPRTGVTAWTENSSVIALDWARYPFGGGVLDGEFVEAQFIAAANACDVVTNFSTEDGVETRPLYQCGIVCKLGGEDPDAYFDAIVESMAGKWGWGGGHLTVVAGVYRQPVLSIDQTWFTGKENITVVKDQPRTEAVNVFRPTLVNADGYVDGATGPRSSIAYTAAPGPEVRSAAYVAEDGSELARELVLEGVTRVVHSQHICGVKMREGRDALAIRGSFDMRAWCLEMFDNVWLTLPVLGLVAKPFEVVAWEFSIDNGVVMTLRETAAEIYDPSAGLKTLSFAPNTSLPLPWEVQTPSGLAITSGDVELDDGTMQTRVMVTWDAPTDPSVLNAGRIEVQYIDATLPVEEGLWSSLLVDGSTTSTVVTGLRRGAPYLFRVRAINTLSVRSSWALHKVHQVAQVPPVDTEDIEPGAVAEVLSVEIANTTWTYSASAGGNEHEIAVIPYTNTGTGDVSCEVTASLVSRVSTGTANWLNIFNFQVWKDADYPRGSGGSVPYAKSAKYMAEYLLGPSTTHTINPSGAWQFDLEPNELVYLVFFTALTKGSGSSGGSNTIDLEGVNLRLTIVKR